MSKQTEALKLALEPVMSVYITKDGIEDWWHKLPEGRYELGDITAIREALAEQPAQQAPVAIDVGQLEYKGNSVAYIHQKMKAYRNGIDAAWDAMRAKDIHPDGKTSLADMIARHTSPPASKPWVGLSDEEIETSMPGGIYDCLADPWDCGVGDGDEMRSIKKDVVRIARAIEAKLKEKNT